MKKTLIVVIFLSFGPALFAQQYTDKLSLKNKETKKESASLNYSNTNCINPEQFSAGYSQSELINNSVSGKQISELDLERVKVNMYQPETKKKSVLLGALMSAVVPGAGEFYGKNYLKAGIFFGVELISWGAYAVYQVKGNNQTDKFQSYADQYWDVRTYARWLIDQGFPGNESINPDEPNLETLRQEIMQCEAQNFTHTLPEYGSQQYYELIGKYQNFQAGWTNLAHVPTKAPGPYYYETYRDPVFVNYADERQKANDYYDYAKTGIIVVVLNHILSAGDAAWTVSMFNENVKMETGFEIKRYQSPFTGRVGNLPSFNMKVTF
jgi:hypothetical protein